MKKARIALLAAHALAGAWLGTWVGAGTAVAQDMSFSLDETETTATDDGGGTGDLTADAESGDVIGDLAGGGAATEDTSASRDTPEHVEEAREEIYAVQQIYALRLNRVEISPSYSATLNDPFISHNGVGLGLNYWFTNVLAVGANFIWYQGLESDSDINFQVRRSTRLAVPVNQYQLGAHLAFTYVPIYGKFAMFNEFIFQYDLYVLGGVGIMRTRPLPVVDPEIRTFDFDIRVAFNVGIGLRVFITRWLAVFAEIRDYMYLEQVESLDVALGSARTDPTTWTQSSPAFVNNVTTHLGLTFFLPFDFEYRLPR
ncbi:MAG: outer membrane beta-barrel domain-containing protein [Sandaracinus sp.]